MRCDPFVMARNGVKVLDCSACSLNSFTLSLSVLMFCHVKVAMVAFSDMASWLTLLCR